MSERNRNIAQTKLALAIAEGTSIALWAKDNGVPRRTAYRWAKEPKVQAVVAFCRRGAVDRAIGRMARSSNWVVHEIADLGMRRVRAGAASCTPGHVVRHNARVAGRRARTSH